jgi:hypothetical protein
LPSGGKPVVSARAGFPTSKAPIPVDCLLDPHLYEMVDSTGGSGNRNSLSQGRRRRPVCTDRMGFFSASRCGAPFRHQKADCRVRTESHDTFLHCRASKSPTRRSARNHTYVTKCQTPHNHPTIRETAGAAVHAAVETVAIEMITAVAATVIMIAVPETAGVPDPSGPRNSARRARALRVHVNPLH